MLGTLVDPIATMINSSGDTIAAMIASRLLGNDRVRGLLIRGADYSGFDSSDGRGVGGFFFLDDRRRASLRR